MAVHSCLGNYFYSRGSFQQIEIKWNKNLSLPSRNLNPLVRVYSLLAMIRVCSPTCYLLLLTGQVLIVLVAQYFVVMNVYSSRDITLLAVLSEDYKADICKISKLCSF